MPTLAEQVHEYVRAVFTGIYVQTAEQNEAVEQIRTMVRENQGWRLCEWDAKRGIRFTGPPPESMQPQQAQSSRPSPYGNPQPPARRPQPRNVAHGEFNPHVPDTESPIAALSVVTDLANGNDPVLCILRNYHRYIGTNGGNPQIIAAVANTLFEGREKRIVLIVMAPSVQIPPELERNFVVLNHELPSRTQLDAMARSLATQPGDMPETDDEVTMLLDAAVGLTASEAENAFSLSLITHSKLVPEELWNLKTQALKKSGLLGLYRGTERFDTIGGLQAMKEFALRSLRHDRPTGTKALGVMIIGHPGTGKSAWAKALGAEVGRPTLTLDIGNLMGSLVGQTEHNVQKALDAVDAMAPAILFIDEIEKGLAGATSGHQGDSGVGARLLGKLLTWLQDHTSDVYVVCTANNLQQLLSGAPEFARSERFDAIFFVDFPRREEKDVIWDMYIRFYGLDADQAKPSDENWTGAEIKSCCRLASLLGLPLVSASRNVVPVADTSIESIIYRREWATNRALDANSGGRYTGTAGAQQAQATPQRRRASR